MAGPAWEYAVGLYERPGVRDACLELQDTFGVDVPTLLVSVWAARELGVDDPAVVTEMRGATADWARRVVAPARRARRAAKDTAAAASLAAAELTAERELIERLAAVAARHAASIPGAPDADVGKLISGWLAHLMADPHATQLLGVVVGVVVGAAVGVAAGAPVTIAEPLPHPGVDPAGPLRMSLLQVASPTAEPREERVGRVLAAVESEIADRDPHIVVLPELWTTGFFHFDRYASEAEPLDGPTATALRALAARTGVWLWGGSFVERAADGALHNTTVCYSPAGELAGAYRKVHLFGFESDEARLLTPGVETPVVRTPFGPIGMTTCYDLRFPELYRELLDRGAELVVVASAWPAARRDHWDLFTRARAVENLGVVAACNASGEQAGVPLGGRSVVVAPWGEVLAQGGDTEEWVRASVDLSEVATRRGTFPALADRRL